MSKSKRMKKSMWGEFTLLSTGMLVAIIALCVLSIVLYIAMSIPPAKKVVINDNARTFTQEELDTVLRPCVEEYAQNLEITVDEAYALLKKNYDGYHFSPRSKDVYAPFSLLKALDKQTTDPYWFDSGTSKSLIEHLQHPPEFNPLDFDGAELSVNAFNVPCEKASTPIPLLYQSGYLTIKDYDVNTGLYTLDFPNIEVRKGFVALIAGGYLKKEEMQTKNWASDLSLMFKKCDLDGIRNAYTSFLASIPYEADKDVRALDYETHFQYTFYIINRLLSCYITLIEKQNSMGRADIIVESDHDIYIFEFKLDGSAREALDQIEEKHFVDSLMLAKYEDLKGKTAANESVFDAMGAAGITNFEIVGLGGDDVFVIVPAKKAIMFSKYLIEKYYEIFDREYGAGSSTMSVGIAIAKTSTPVKIILEAAEEKLAEAKSLSKNMENDKGSMSFIILDSHNDNEGRVNTTTSAVNTLLPYSIQTANDILKFAGYIEKEKNVSNSRIRNLSDAFENAESYEEASLFFQYMNAKFKITDRKTDAVTGVIRLPEISGYKTDDEYQGYYIDDEGSHCYIWDDLINLLEYAVKGESK